MSLTIDFILLVILVIIPGLLFKRFYFYGEFSKQFSTQEPIYTSILYSIIPGILIQILAFLVYILFRGDLNNTDLIQIVKELFAKENQYSEATIKFLGSGYKLFILHEVVTFLLAILLGMFLSRLVRVFKLDRKWKLLRFKNQWYYIFSGEILTFKKFNVPLPVNIKTKGTEQQQTYFPAYVDLLVKSKNDPEIISGYVIDYDLKSDDISKLDKVYLAHVSRYREHRETDSESLEKRGNKVKVPIPGRLFIQKAEDIINMNVFYLPSDLKKSSTKNRDLSFKYLEIIILLFNLYFTLDISLIHSKIALEVFNIFLPNHAEFSALSLFIFSQLFTQLTSLAIPEKIKYNNPENSNQVLNRSIYQYSASLFFRKIVIWIIYAIIFKTISYF